MIGKLYGVGVGPGDPELMTIKAARIIKECDVIAVPGKIPEESIAFRIARQACPEIDEKLLIGIPMPMTKDEKVLKRSHEEGVLSLKHQLDEGKDTAFLTLGDPTVYSTYLYLHNEIRKGEYEAEIISGVPSFCAAAAKLHMSIGEKDEQIHVIPASYQVEGALGLPGTKVLMKAGKKLPDVKKLLREQNAESVMVENCGMENERIYHGTENIPEDAGYYTLLFVKERGGEQ